MVHCRRMTVNEVPDTLEMLTTFLGEDEHYLASSEAYGDRGADAAREALDLFLQRPELGFVWLAYDDDGIAAMCVICYAISTSLGALVAKLDDVSVKADRRGKGVGTALLNELKKELLQNNVLRIDVAVHVDNPEARGFYEKLGFVPLNEERMAALVKG